MRTLQFGLFILLAGLPLSSQAAVSQDMVPASAVWYLHADFEEMRSGGAGESLFLWLDEEIFEDIREDIGIDFSKEANQLTAFAAPDKGIVVIVDGNISQTSKDKMLALATLTCEMETFESGGKPYYFVAGDDSDAGDEGDEGGINMEIESLEDAAYFSFALKNKVILTSSQENMESLLASNGKIAAAENHEGALFVLSADRSLVQGGVNTDEFSYDDDWDSNILRNARQVAVLVADAGGKITIEAQLVTTEPEMAESLASIARGLISLQAFSNDMDPELKTFLNNTKVDVDGSALRISVSLDPEVVVAIIAD